MALEIDITLQSSDWETAIPDVETLAQGIVTKALQTVMPKHQDLEISIVLADDTFIQSLNSTYRHKDKPTNVLSFPLTEPDDLNKAEFQTLGDIVIAFETIQREAEEQDKTLQDHFTHMLIHGCLHLLHYDHETEDEALDMETLETSLLNSFGIKNPYETL